MPSLSRIAAITLILLGTTLTSSFSAAQIYKYVDKDGNVVYTDKPGDNREAMHLQPLPTISLPKPGQQLRPANAQSQKSSGVAYDQLQFTSPKDNSAFWSGNGNFVISVEATPSLRVGDKFKVTYDGKSLGTNTSGAFPVQHADRGTHTASVSVVNLKGDEVQSGPTITFTVHRPSVIRRNQRQNNN